VSAGEKTIAYARVYFIMIYFIQL